MNSSEISATQFRAWLNDDVTKTVFGILKKHREDVNLQLTNANLIMSEEASKRLPYLVGKRDGLDLTLESQYEDIMSELAYSEVEEIDKDDEHSPSGAQSIN